MVWFRTLLLLPLLFACASAGAGGAPRAVCTAQYVNFAWGAQNKGVLLDSAGLLYSFDLHGLDAGAGARLMNMDGKLPLADVLKAMTEGPVPPRPVADPAAIAAKLPLIAEAARTPATGPGRHTAYDAGSRRITCYRFDAATGAYAAVLLDQRGDWTNRNTSPAAAGLLEWLAGVDPAFS